MKILVYGAGVLGTLYAARLQESGQDVSIVARGSRLADVRRYGLVLEDLTTGRRLTSRVRAIESLTPDARYDLIIVLMRKNQVPPILPILASSSETSKILFMHNNAAGPDQMVNVLGRARVFLGFPGAGGAREGPLVRYAIIPQQRTTLGELDGQVTPFLQQVADMFHKAGFPVSFSSNIDAWLKTHAAFVTAVSGALYMAECDNYRLARTPGGILLMVRGVREGFRALGVLGLPITPRSIRIIFERVPWSVSVLYWRRYLNSRMGEYVFARHARDASAEMKHLADEFRSLIRPTSVPTPALDRLYGYIDEYAASVTPVTPGAS